MTTETTALVTPFEDTFYAPDWRYQLATTMAEDPDYKHPSLEAMRDPGVRETIKHLKAGQPKTVRPNSLRARFDRVQRWGLDGPHRHTGHVIEALFLTAAPMSAIAKDVGCSLMDLRSFERLFFCVRDDDGNMSLSAAQKQFFATEGTYQPTQQRPEYLMWRRVAVAAGYGALIGILELGPGSWKEAPKVDLAEVTTSMTKTETLARVAAGGMPTGDLIKLESVRIKDKVVRHQTGELKATNEGMELALNLLRALAPKMVDTEKINQAQAMEAAKDRVQAETEIGKTEIDDRGPFQSNEEIDQALADAMAPLRKNYEENAGIAGG